jgi:hypothetical protein
MEHEDDWQDHNTFVEMLPLTRSMKRVMESEDDQPEPTLTQAHKNTTKSRSANDRRLVTPILEQGRLSWKRSPREQGTTAGIITCSVDQWVGFQLDHDNLPAKYTHGPPQGELIKRASSRTSGYPESLGYTS